MIIIVFFLFRLLFWYRKKQNKNVFLSINPLIDWLIDFFCEKNLTPVNKFDSFFSPVCVVCWFLIDILIVFVVVIFLIDLIDWLINISLDLFDGSFKCQYCCWIFFFFPTSHFLFLYWDLMNLMCVCDVNQFLFFKCQIKNWRNHHQTSRSVLFMNFFLFEKNF